MKYRDYKQFAAGNYYHVFNRGNNKQDIFTDPKDYIFFLKRLRENLFPEQSQTLFLSHRSKGRSPYVRKTLPAGAFTLVCYCLMPNHFHLLIRQNSDVGVDRLIAKVCTGYSIYFNKCHNSVGSVLQAKFKAILVDSDSYLLWLSAYIHQNPKVAELVENLEDYKWSSYPDYIGKRDGNLCQKDLILSGLKDQSEYIKFVEQSYQIIKIRKEMKHLYLDA